MTDWRACIVAAPGPSLATTELELCRGVPTIVVNDAWRLMPWAEILYAHDRKYWTYHRGVPEFTGARYSAHGPGNAKQDLAELYGINLVAGRYERGFSTVPGVVHYGRNSGFQAINLALLLGAELVLLIGFDMHAPQGRRHFFGDHPAPLSNSLDYRTLVPKFDEAARMLSPRVEILNCTPKSALHCFPMVSLEVGLNAVQKMQASSGQTADAAGAQTRAARGAG